LYVAADLWSIEFAADEYDEFEYAGLPVRVEKHSLPGTLNAC
jgi:hypothetical protein